MDQLQPDPLMRETKRECVTFSPRLYTGKDENANHEEPPRISVIKIRKSAGKIVDFLSGHIGNVMSGTNFFDLVKDVCTYLDYPISKRKTVIDSLQEYSGVVLNLKMLWRLCFRIDSNKDIIYKDEVIPHWQPDKTTVWVPVHVVDVERVDIKEGKPLIRLHVLILSGRPAGSLIIQQMPVKYVRFFLKEIGVPKYDDVSELEVFNTMFTVLIDKTDSKSTAMVKFHVNSAQKKHNSTLHRNRSDCPNNMPWFCDRCPYGLDKCQYAIKRKTWIINDCINGHKGYFKKRKDGTYSEYCVKCSYAHIQKINK